MVVNTPLETSSINSGWAGVASRQTFDEAGERVERDAVETSQGRSGDTVGARDLVHVMTPVRSKSGISKVEIAGRKDRRQIRRCIEASLPGDCGRLHPISQLDPPRAFVYPQFSRCVLRQCAAGLIVVYHFFHPTEVSRSIPYPRS